MEDRDRGHDLGDQILVDSLIFGEGTVGMKSNVLDVKSDPGAKPDFPPH